VITLRRTRWVEYVADMERGEAHTTGVGLGILRRELGRPRHSRIVNSKNGSSIIG
jgi:hypothetical protein